MTDASIQEGIKPSAYSRLQGLAATELADGASTVTLPPNVYSARAILNYLGRRAHAFDDKDLAFVVHHELQLDLAEVLGDDEVHGVSTDEGGDF